MTIDHQNLIAPFDFSISPNSTLPKETTEAMREICDVSSYLKALAKSGIDMKAMPFSSINRKNLYESLEILEKLAKVLIKIEGMNPRPYGENERNKLQALREKVWYLSSRFYEVIPHEEFRNQMVPPISAMNNLEQKMTMIQNLI